MKNMFDCLEETYKEGDIIFIVKVIKNKRHNPRKQLYLSCIDEGGNLCWCWSISNALNTIPGTIYYMAIKELILMNNVMCSFIKMPRSNYKEYIKSAHQNKQWWWKKICRMIKRK